jgi:type II secretory pathway component PulF
MPTFRYKATNSDGTPTDGVIDADDAASARAVLLERGLTVEQVAPESDAQTRDGDASANPSHSEPSFTAREQVEVLGQLGSAMNAGLPLSVGLRTLAEETRSTRLKSAFTDMGTQLDEGRPLDDVVTDFSKAMPAWLLQMIRSGRESGTLAHSVAHYIHFTRLRNRLRGRVIAALIYPGILLGVLFLIAVALFGYLLPQFKSLFEAFGVELPSLTVALIAASDLTVFLLENAVVTVPVVLLVLWGGAVFLRSVVGPATARRFAYEIPLVGRALKLTGLSEFCHLLALLIENRIPLPQALTLVGSAMTDPCLAQCADDAAYFVERGESLADVQARMPNVPVELLRVPGWDQPDESLPHGLRASGEIFASQCDVNARAMAGAATPIVVLSVGVLAIVTVIGLFMPLIKLVNDLS